MGGVDGKFTYACMHACRGMDGCRGCTGWSGVDRWSSHKDAWMDAEGARYVLQHASDGLPAAAAAYDARGSSRWPLPSSRSRRPTGPPGTAVVLLVGKRGGGGRWMGTIDRLRQVSRWVDQWNRFHTSQPTQRHPNLHPPIHRPIHPYQQPHPPTTYLRPAVVVARHEQGEAEGADAARLRELLHHPGRVPHQLRHGLVLLLVLVGSLRRSVVVR